MFKTFPSLHWDSLFKLMSPKQAAAKRAGRATSLAGGEDILYIGNEYHIFLSIYSTYKSLSPLRQAHLYARTHTPGA